MDIDFLPGNFFHVTQKSFLKIILDIIIHLAIGAADRKETEKKGNNMPVYFFQFCFSFILIVILPESGLLI